MTAKPKSIQEFAGREYQYGFQTPIEAVIIPKGLSEETVRLISERKKEPPFMLAFRLKAYRHWLTMKEPAWANVTHAPIDYQEIIYYSAPKQSGKLKSMDDVDPELKKTFEKLGIPLMEQKKLAGVAVDAIFDSVSVATSYKEKLLEAGVVFCPFSEAVEKYPDLVKKYMGSVVPYTDNFYAGLNSAVFSDGSFVYVPKGVKCPMELSSYFRINTEGSGQFERTLIIAEDGAYVSYLEGCLPRWEEVSTGHLIKPIVDIATHDTVTNGSGRQASVSKIMKRRYRGDLIRVIPRSPGNQFALTPEHPVLAVKRSRVQGSSRGANRWPDLKPQKLENTEPRYVKAGELSEGDLLVFPVVKTVRQDPTLSDAFLRLLGYYVAEGCATIFNGYDALEFSLGKHETKNIREVVRLIRQVTGKKPSVTYDHGRNGAYIVVYSKRWCDEFVKHGGKYAAQKELSRTVMELPPSRQKLFLGTYYKGDGSKTKEGRLVRVRAATVSRQLAFQIQELWTRQGRFVFINVREPYREAMKDGRIISHRRKYTLYHSENARSRRTIRRNGYFLVPVRKIRRQSFDDYVYNFETKKEPHSYSVKGFSVHNCTAPKFDTNQLHAAVVELVTLEDAEIKYSTVQNWYAGDPKTGRGGIYNFVTKRGKCLGARSKISWTQVETGSAITWKYPSCVLLGDDSVGAFYSVALTNHHQQADTGSKMTHIGRRTKSTIISKGISAGASNNNYRGLVDIRPSAEGARNFTQCDSLLIGPEAQANTFPTIDVRNPSSQVEHEATTSKISDDQLFYFLQRGIGTEEAMGSIINGFCRDVFRELPGEFAVEATQLLGLKLENTVG